MKRSEMLDIIMKRMFPEHNTTGTHPQGYKRKRHWCSELLRDMERAGMLPPIDYVDETGYSNNWEDEE